MVYEQKLWQETYFICKQSEDKSLAQAVTTISGVHKYFNGYIYLKVENDLERYRFEKFYLNKMNDILATLTTEKVAFKIITAEEDSSNNDAPEVNNKNEASSIQSRMLIPEYTFDNFVLGEANKEAYTFASKIAASKNTTINPFYIFGGVGLGKTHLMNAIGHEMLKSNPELNIVFVTAQQFIEDFFKAKNRNQKNYKLQEEFDFFYQRADIFLVDDIQFLEGKNATQEEFFKIFEYLFSMKKQIVITSDRPAAELDIMARLKSRFSWGIQTNVKAPNQSLRESIIKEKLKGLIDNPDDVPNNVIEYIASTFDQNVRELEGAMRRFVSYCVSFDVPFDLEQAETILAPITTKKVAKDDYNEKLGLLKDCVARYFNINVKEITSKSRKKELVYARNLVIYIARYKFDISLNQLGDALGRDHTTMMHSYQKMCDEINSDEYVKNDVSNILKLIDKK